MPSIAQKKRGMLIPEQVNGHELICVTMHIPNDQTYRAAFMGAINNLGKAFYWDMSYTENDRRASMAALYWRSLINDYLEIGECDVPSNPIPAGLAVGMVTHWAGNLPLPDGLLLCDGSTYNAVDYPELWSVINDTYKNLIDNTFIVPDMRGKFAFGVEDGNVFNATAGSKTHQLSIAEMPVHTHVQNSHTHTQNSHNHGQEPHTHLQNPHNHTQAAHQHNLAFNAASGLGSGVPARGDNSGTSTNNQTNAVTPNIQNTTATNIEAIAQNLSTIATNQSSTATNQSSGGGDSHNNMPPYRTLYFCIVAKTVTGGEPREIVIDSQLIPPDGECKNLYWRYLSEPSSANRFLATVCDGDQGDTGAPGKDGECPDCTTTPAQPPNEDSGGIADPPDAASNSCRIATGVSKYVIDQYALSLTNFIEEVETNAMALSDFGRWLIDKMPVFAGLAIPTFLFEWIAQVQAKDATALLSHTTNSTYNEKIKCHLLCVIEKPEHNGTINSVSFSEWTSEIYNDDTIDSQYRDDLQVWLQTVPLYELKIEALSAVSFGIAADCEDCDDCGDWCYTWDLLAAPGNWIDVGGLISNWSDGIGLNHLDRNNDLGGAGYARRRVNVYHEFTEARVTEISFTYVLSPGSGDDSFTGISISNNLSMSDPRLKFGLFYAPIGTQTYTWTGDELMSYVRLMVVASIDSTSPFNSYGGSVQIRSITMRGRGENPFGANNC